MNQSCRTFQKQGLLALSLYVVVLILSLEIISKFHVGWWKFPIAVAPILPCLLFVRALMARFSRCDELQMKIHLQSLAFAFAGTAILTLTYGFLQNVGFPKANWVWVWPLMGSLWAIGAAIAQQRYR